MPTPAMGELRVEVVDERGRQILEGWSRGSVPIHSRRSSASRSQVDGAEGSQLPAGTARSLPVSPLQCPLVLLLDRVEIPGERSDSWCYDPRDDFKGAAALEISQRIDLMSLGQQLRPAAPLLLGETLGG